MLKKEIKKEIKAMSTGDRIDFFSIDGRVDQVTKMDYGYRWFSLGRGWTDQAPMEVSATNAMVDYVWAEKPHSSIWQ